MRKKVEHGELYAVGHLGDIISISLKEISKENARFMDFVISREEYSKHFSAYISQHLDTVGKEFNAYAQAKYRSYNSRKTLLDEEDIKEFWFISTRAIGKMIFQEYEKPVPNPEIKIGRRGVVTDVETVLRTARNKLYERFQIQYNNILDNIIPKQ